MRAPIAFLTVYHHLRSNDGPFLRLLSDRPEGRSAENHHVRANGQRRVLQRRRICSARPLKKDHTGILLSDLVVGGFLQHQGSCTCTPDALLRLGLCLGGLVRHSLRHSIEILMETGPKPNFGASSLEPRRPRTPTVSLSPNRHAPFLMLMDSDT